MTTNIVIMGKVIIVIINAEEKLKMKTFNKEAYYKTAQAVKENPKAGIEKFKAHLEFEEGLRANIPPIMNKSEVCF